jgi:hypothetical protein
VRGVGGVGVGGVGGVGAGVTAHSGPVRESRSLASSSLEASPTFLVTGFIVIALLHARPERTTSTPEAVEDHIGNPAVADRPPQT